MQNYIVCILFLIFLGIIEQGYGIEEKKGGPWGTYKPGRYMAIQRAQSKSPLIGLAYGDAGVGGLRGVRDRAKSGVDVEWYRYVWHAGPKGSKHEMRDEALGVHLTSEFLRLSDEDTDDNDHWVWTLRGEPLRRPSKPHIPLEDRGAGPTPNALSLYVYVGHPDPEQPLSVRLGVREGRKRASVRNSANSLAEVRWNDQERVTVKLGAGETPPVREFDECLRIPSLPRSLDGWHTACAHLSHDSLESGAAGADFIQEQLLQAVRTVQTEQQWALREWVSRQSDESLSTEANKTPPPRIHGYFPLFGSECSTDSMDSSNTAVLQRIVLVGEQPFELQVEYRRFDTIRSVTPEQLETARLLAEQDAHERFGRMKRWASKPWANLASDDPLSIVANVVGGVGHHYGDLIEFAQPLRASPQGNGPELARVSPTALLTGCPSRSFFPRGFLWDEGFHQLVLLPYLPHWSLDIMDSWFAQMRENGWIPREIMLGAEGRRDVPPEFVPQHPWIANPPTFSFPIVALARAYAHYQTSQTLDSKTGDTVEVDSSSSTFSSSSSHFISDDSPSQSILDDDSFSSSSSSSTTTTTTTTTTVSSSSLTGGAYEQVISSQLSHDHVWPRVRPFLERALESMKRHFDWFHQTQAVKGFRDGASAFQWFGRTENHTLASGLDDYPRFQKPHKLELHVDLTSWMAHYARSIATVARALGRLDEAASYDARAEKIVSVVLSRTFWDASRERFCDSIWDGRNERPNFHYAAHDGYVSLFPFALGLLPPEDSRISAVLDLVEDPSLLRSPFGLRSLSAADSLFGSNENYWRGPIWMNVNYLVLSQLHALSLSQGPHSARAARLTRSLRDDLASNVLREFASTRFTWEQYHPSSGKGQRTRPFSGWTSLVTLILSDLYPH